MDSGDSACPEQGFDDGGSEPDSSGSVNVGTSEKCVVCGLDTAEPLSRVGRGISSFLDQCTAIGRTDLVEFIRCNPDICPVVHKSCRKDVYNKSVTASRQSAAGDSQTPSRKRTRACTVAFDFKSLCFYCCKPTAECKRDEWHCVETMEMHSTILDAADSRPDDPWALEIKGRQQYATDLVAVEARYHFECHRNFTAGRQHTPHKVRRGRPVREVAQNVFNDLCDELLVNGENRVFHVA